MLIDQRVLLPEGNMFKTYSRDTKTPIREDAVSELPFKTAFEYQAERMAKREAKSRDVH